MRLEPVTKRLQIRAFSLSYSGPQLAQWPSGRVRNGSSWTVDWFNCYWCTDTSGQVLVIKLKLFSLSCLLSLSFCWVFGPSYSKPLFVYSSAVIFFPCLHDRATVRSGAEIGLLSLRLSVSQGASLGDFLLASACPIEKVTHWGEIEPFSATLAQDGLAECNQPGKNPLKYSAVAGNWTRAKGRTDSELSHWPIMTDSYHIKVVDCASDQFLMFYTMECGNKCLRSKSDDLTSLCYNSQQDLTHEKNGQTLRKF